MDLALKPAINELVGRTTELVRDVVIPVEEDCGGVVRSEHVRVALQTAAKAAGVFAPHVPTEFGGHGLNMCDRAPMRETFISSTMWALPSSGSAISSRWPVVKSGRALR